MKKIRYSDITQLYSQKFIEMELEAQSFHFQPSDNEEERREKCSTQQH